MVIGGPVSNYAVIENDTLYEGGWDTGLRIHNIQGDTVVYDCLHYFESICTRWCDNAHTDSNSFSLNSRIGRIFSSDFLLFKVF